MSAPDSEVKVEESPETVEDNGSAGVVDVNITLPDHTVVVIPSVYIGESLATFKQILLDYQECAAFTCYSLRLRSLVAGDSSNSEVDVECNEFTELSTLLEPTTTACTFELVPGEYNLKKVQDQLKRVNEILANPPTTKGAVNTQTKKDQGKEKTGRGTDNKSAAQNSALPKTDDLFKSIELSNFYGEVLYRTGDVEKVSKSGRMPTSKPLGDAVRSVFASGWNPVPPQRKVRGDLLYIEVVTANEGTIYITAVPSGFYVSKCNRSYFDPSPAANHCFSHELFETLLKASATLRSAWSSVLSTRNVAGQTDAETATPLDVMAWMYSQGRGQLTAEGGMPTLQWNAYHPEAYRWHTEGAEASARPSENAHHSYNLFRTQQELSSLHGVEELGAPREWNDEIQSIRALKAGDASEKVMKAKLEYKVLSEFAAACRSTAVAISEGLIAPLSIGDPSQSEIYVYNGIFFSKAEDTKDSFKLCVGDDAYRKCTARELQNQRLIRALEVEGVGLILSAIVDYKGERIIGQSIIPGIFAQGENVARLMYGILDKEKVLTVKDPSLKLMTALGEKLNIPVRNTKLFPFGEPAAVDPAAAEGEEKAPGMLEEVQSTPIKVDDVDNVVGTDSASTPHAGPIEGKVLRGSDGRDYVLEMMRLTPRDASYIAGEKGTGKVAQLDLADKDIAATYILRRELIDLFISNKLNAQRQKVMKEATEKQRELIAALKAKASEEESKETKEGEDKKEAAEPTLDEETGRKLAEEYGAKMKEITVASLGLSINPNCFLDYEFDVDPAVREKDEATAKELALFLWETVLPAVTKQVRDGDIQPKDNATLVKVLHRHGVNMRYLGALIDLAATEEKEDEELLAQGKQKVHAMPHYWRELLTIEVIARAAKYVLNGYYQDSAVYASPAQTVASFLNHVLSLFVPVPTPATEGTAPATAAANTEGASKKGKKGKKSSNNKTETAASTAAAAKTDTPVPVVPCPDATGSREDSLKALQKTIATRFCHHLHLVQSEASSEADVAATAKFLQSRVSAVALLRRICQACGIQIATRKYNFSTAAPFFAADVLGLVPIVRSCEPESLLPEFEEMLESSRAYQQEGNHGYAYELAQQALSTITQITGPYHAQSARALDQLTNVLINAGDYPAALQYAQKSLAIAIHLHGFDSQESAMHHLKLSILESEVGNRAAAAQHLQTSKYLLQLMTGASHTELSTIYARFATLYEEAGDFESVWQCYARAKFHTTDLMQICALNIALAAACAKNGHPFEAVELQKQAYHMLKELLGDRDESQLAEVKATLETYMRTVSEQKMVSQEVNEQLKEMMEKMAKASLQPAGVKDQDKSAEQGQLSEAELFAAFEEIDARAERAKKAAKKQAKLEKQAKVEKKAKK